MALLGMGDDGGRVEADAVVADLQQDPSTTLKDPTWQNTHVIDGDVEAAVRELKAKPGRELQVHGSGDLLRWLLERDLVDELNFRIYPVIVGDGLRLFPGARPDAQPGTGRIEVDVTSA